ncbi:unnamed protein product [Pleuronectes platessa]|uniref:Uncharacterized protein n=1 Tax=Pleuronectes platessa TaxID=8262 RepID=A0A9N7TXG8_PLEPL|nr:unnamed protein product [Pleuronectes platessa]
MAPSGHHLGTGENPPPLPRFSRSFFLHGSVGPDATDTRGPAAQHAADPLDRRQQLLHRALILTGDESGRLSASKHLTSHKRDGYTIMRLSRLSGPHVLSEVNIELMSLALGSTRCSALWLNTCYPSLAPANYS